jgi:hypothetical protein
LRYDAQDLAECTRQEREELFQIMAAFRAVVMHVDPSSTLPFKADWMKYDET